MSSVIQWNVTFIIEEIISITDIEEKVNNRDDIYFCFNARQNFRGRWTRPSETILESTRVTVTCHYTAWVGFHSGSRQYA